MDHVRVGGDDEPPIADGNRGAIVHRGEPDAAWSDAASEPGQADLLDQRPHGPPASPVLQADPVVDDAAAMDHAMPPRSG